MKYFTKEELAEITEKLIENPTREILKELNNKYNGNDTSKEITPATPEVNIENTIQMEQPIVKEIPDVTVNEPVLNQNVNPENTLPIEPLITEEKLSIVQPTFEPTPVITSEAPVVSPLPQVEQPVMETLGQNEIPANNINMGPEIPSFEVPQQAVQEVNNNSELINFTGNLWEPQEQNNLMTTTDNFNTVETQNTEVPVQNTQFFGNTQQSVNNPIPVSEAMPHIPTPQGPSMFGQFEQNYNG